MHVEGHKSQVLAAVFHQKRAEMGKLVGFRAEIMVWEKAAKRQEETSLVPWSSMGEFLTHTDGEAG